MTETIKINPYNRNIPELSQIQIYYKPLATKNITLPTTGITGITYKVLDENERT